MKIFDRYLDATLADEASLVDDPAGRGRRVVRREFVAGVGAVFLYCVSRFLPDPWEDVAMLPVALYIGWHATTGALRVWAYRRGWIAARIEFLGRLSEALRRDMPLEDWLRVEMQRDWFVMTGGESFPSDGPGRHRDGP